LPPLISNLYQHNDKGRDSGFTLYYLSKNVGALLGPIICGIIAVHYGFHYAFLVSAIIMLIGILIFIFGKKHLPKSQNLTLSKNNLLKVKNTLVYLGILISIPLMQFIFIKNIDSYLLLFGFILVTLFFVYLFRHQPIEQRKNLILIITMLLFAAIFIAFLAQGGSTLNLFIERIVNRHLFGTIVPTSFFYAIDPIFMLSIGPLLALLFIKLANYHKEPSAITKSSVGLILLAVGFTVFAIASYYAENTGRTSPLFIVLAYFIFPIAELLVVPPILSLITKLSPKNKMSTMVSIFMFSQGLGGYLTGQISKLGQIDFAITNLITAKEAAFIYQNSFTDCAIVLFIAGMILLVIKKYSVTKNNN